MGSRALALLLLTLFAVATCKEAYATVISGSGFTSPARVLLASIRRFDTERDFVVLVTSNVPENERNILKKDGMKLVECEIPTNPFVDKKDGRIVMKSVVFVKFYSWALTDYTRVVYIDSDAIIRDKVDPLFDCPHDFCAVPDCCPFDYLNAGVMSMKPNMTVFEDLKKRLHDGSIPDSWDGADQGFFYHYFDWANAEATQRLSIRYNGIAKQLYRMGSFVTEPWALIHYAGIDKPWDWRVLPLLDLPKFWWEAAALVPDITPTSSLILLTLLVVAVIAIESGLGIVLMQHMATYTPVALLDSNPAIQYIVRRFYRPSAFLVLVLATVLISTGWLSAVATVPLFTPPAAAWILAHLIIMAVGTGPVVLLMFVGRVGAMHRLEPPGMRLLPPVVAMSLVSMAIPGIGQLLTFYEVYCRETMGALVIHVVSLTVGMFLTYSMTFAALCGVRAALYRGSRVSERAV